jgi:hypothetical protein
MGIISSAKMNKCLGVRIRDAGGVDMSLIDVVM